MNEKKMTTPFMRGLVKRIVKDLYGNGQQGLLKDVITIKVQNKFIMGGMGGILVLMFKVAFFPGS